MLDSCLSENDRVNSCLEIPSGPVSVFSLLTEEILGLVNQNRCFSPSQRLVGISLIELWLSPQNGAGIVYSQPLLQGS